MLEISNKLRRKAHKNKAQVNIEIVNYNYDEDGQQGMENGTDAAYMDTLMGFRYVDR